jgi:segregation and condensation protein B
MFGTTKVFLDYFSLKKLNDLPPLADLSDWESLRVQLDLPDVEGQVEAGEETDEVSSRRDVPVLLPEGENDPDAALYEDAMEEAEVLADEEAPSDDPEEELVVNEWPDPLA